MVHPAIIAAGAAALPFVSACLVYTLYGWPKDGRGPFNPRRVFALNIALIDQLLSVKHAPLFLRWTSHYRNASAPHVHKDIPYGTGRTLDVYAASSPSLSSQGSVRSAGAASGRSETSRETLCPVVIFVYGGAWGNGDKSMYGLLASRIAREGILVIVPNYVLHPQGVVEDMTRDIRNAYAWTRSNALSYGGDRERITLVGHSAGAHLCILSVMTCPELAVKSVVGLSGVYDIADHYRHEHGRGVESVSPMRPVMGGPSDFAQHSPSRLVEDGLWPPACAPCIAGRRQRALLDPSSHVHAQSDLVGSALTPSSTEHDSAKLAPGTCLREGKCAYFDDGIATTAIPDIVLAHGVLDATVPVHSSVRLARALKSAGVPVRLDIFPDGTHADFVLDLMCPQRKLHNALVDVIVGAVKRT